MSVEHVSNPPARRSSMPEVVSIRSKVRVPPVTQTLGTSNARPGDRSAWSADSKQRPGARLEIPSANPVAWANHFPINRTAYRSHEAPPSPLIDMDGRSPVIFRTRDSCTRSQTSLLQKAAHQTKFATIRRRGNWLTYCFGFHQGLVWITPSWRLIGIAMRLRQKNEERLRGRHHVQAQESQASHDDPVGYRRRPYSAESHSSAQLIAAKPAPFARTPQRFPTGPFQELFSRPRPLPPR